GSAVAAGGDETAARAQRPLEFGRDVRPILSNHCFPCHGPDEGRRKAGLRLDTFEGATATLKDGAHALVPGDLDASELVQRSPADSPKRRMPAASLGKPLSDAQIDLLKRWVAGGGEYKRHWSFVPPRRDSAARDAIDRLLLARLRDEGLAPAPEAGRETLIRRATLALTGLP